MKYKKSKSTTKNKIIKLIKNGEDIKSVSEKYNIPSSTIYSWTNGKKYIKRSSITLHEYNNLVKHAARQETIVSVLKYAMNYYVSSRQDRYEVMDELYSKYDFNVLCDAFDVDRGTYHNHRTSISNNHFFAERRAYMLSAIQKIHDDSHGIYGVKKVTAELRRSNMKVSESYVRSCMHELGIAGAVRRGKQFNRSWQNRKVNLMHAKYNITSINQFWVSDVATFRVKNNNYYACVFLDIFSKKIIAVRLSKNNSTNLITKTLNEAFKNQGKPKNLIWHTDRGSNYAAKAVADRCKELGITHSFSRPHSPKNNAFAESFIGVLRSELVYFAGGKIRSKKHLSNAIIEYKDWYNNKRIHPGIKNRTPVELEMEYTC